MNVVANHRTELLSRALLAACSLVIAASLFLPWFEGVSGWEHFAWADVALVIVAAAVPVAPRLGVAVLCALGTSVVLGHGFEPDEPAAAALEVGPGAYVALAALAAAGVAALRKWPGVLLVAGAAGLVAALLSGWGGEGSPDGFARWRYLDVALLALAAGLVASATGRAPAALRGLLALGSLAAAACVVAAGRSQLWVDEGGAEGAAMGTVVALLALAVGAAGLALGAKPREPAARDG